MATAPQHAPDLDRVRANTSSELNHRLDLQAEHRLRLAAAGNTDIDAQVDALGREWDFDRTLEAEAAFTGLAGVILALAADKRFLVIPGFAAAMLFLHSQQGWYPLLPLLRRLGFRSQDEIDRERYALKALRGDFQAVAEAGPDAERRAEAAWRAAWA